MTNSRRTQKGYRLRVYIDAIRDAKMTSDTDWIDQWANSPTWAPYLTKEAWVHYLEECMTKEAEVYFRLEAA